MLPGWERAQNDWIPQLALLLALLAAAIPSCCDHQRAAAIRPPTTGQNLVFSPVETAIPPEDLARSDWPFTVVYDHPDETILYRETVMDRQGWVGSDHNRPYRRFDSVRFGRTHR